MLFCLNCVYSLFKLQGGFKIQLLDELERPVLDLTPSIQNSEFLSNDATYVNINFCANNRFNCKYKISSVPRHSKFNCLQITRAIIARCDLSGRRLNGEQITNSGRAPMSTLKHVGYTNIFGLAYD